MSQSSGSEAPPAKKARRELSPLQQHISQDLSNRKSTFRQPRKPTDSSSAHTSGTDDSSDRRRKGSRLRIVTSEDSQSDSGSDRAPARGRALQERSNGGPSGGRQRGESGDSAGSSRSGRRESVTMVAVCKDPKKQEDDHRVCGIIKSVTLKNFMCHEHVNVDFNRHMNFITGKNGSGKSAILTGIVTTLGARVTDMGRGGTLKKLIREGADKAVVKIVLANDGPESFKPDLYGKEIQVERRITHTTTGYRMNDQRGKLVSDKKEELERMLDKFNIRIKNPANVLTQDVAKTFLHKMDSSDLYKLYFKATQLEQISLDYRTMMENCNESKDLLDAKAKHLKEQKKVLKDLEEKIEAHQRLQSDRENLKKLGEEMSWALVRDYTREVEKLDRELEKLEKRLAEHKEKFEKQKEERDAAEANFVEAKGRILELATESERLDGVMKEKKTLVDKQKHNVDNQEHAVQKARTEIRRAETLKREVQHQIDEANAKRGNRDQAREEAEQLTREREGIHKECKEMEERMEEIQAFIQKAQAAFLSARSDCNNLKGSVDELHRELRNVQGELGQMKQAGNSQLKRYGRDFEALVGLINKNPRKFKQKPRGPLGCEMKLKKKEWGRGVEKAIGGVLKSFVCDNQEDSRALQALMRQAGFTSWRPNVIVMRFHGQKHDTRRFSARCEYGTVLEALEIPDPVVFNAVVDQMQPESIILVPDKAQMNQYMRDRPAGSVKMSYDLEGNQAYPHPKYRFYSNVQKCYYLLAESADESIKSLTANVDYLKDEIRKATDAFEEAKEEYDAGGSEKKRREGEQERESRRMEQLKGKIRKITARIEKIQTEEEEADVNIFEEELKKTLEELERVKEKKRQEDELLIHMKAELEERRKDYRQARDDFKGLSTQNDVYDKEVQGLAQVLGDHEEVVKHLRVKMAGMETTKEKVERHRGEKEGEREEKRKLAAALNEEEMETDREVHVIDKEIHRTEKRLEYAEQQVGNIEQVSNEYNEKHKTYKAAVGMVEGIQRAIKELKGAMDMRAIGFKWMKTRINIQMRSAFTIGMKTRDKGKNFKGTMWINDKHRKMILDVEVRKQAGDENASFYDNSRTVDKARSMAAAEQRGLKNLSGGEKSYTMVVLILSFWEAMQFPFRCMDEFDVFMDHINRDLIIEMLIDFGREDAGKPTQFVYFTPQDVTKVSSEVGPDLTTFYLEPPREAGKKGTSGSDE